MFTNDEKAFIYTALSSLTFKTGQSSQIIRSEKICEKLQNSLKQEIAQSPSDNGNDKKEKVKKE